MCINFFIYYLSSAGIFSPLNRLSAVPLSLWLIPLLNFGLKPKEFFTWGKELTEPHSDSNSTLFHSLLHIEQETLKFWEQDLCHTLEMFISADNTQSTSAKCMRKPHGHNLTEHRT